jgi:hypothetical protein
MKLSLFQTRAVAIVHFFEIQMNRGGTEIFVHKHTLPRHQFE